MPFPLLDMLMDWIKSIDRQTKDILMKSIKRIILLSCVGFLAWQCIQCFDKYMARPQVTNLNVTYTSNIMFPAITICVDPITYTHYCADDNKNADQCDRLFNQTQLKKCGINRYILGAGLKRSYFNNSYLFCYFVA